MTSTVRPEEEVLMMAPKFVAPPVAAPCGDKFPTPLAVLWPLDGSGLAASTFRAKTAFQSQMCPAKSKWKKALTIDEARKKICNFDDGQADNPDSLADGSRYRATQLANNKRPQAVARRIAQK